MTCYKLVTCEFKWFGLQSRIENFIQKSERRLFTTFHRDNWREKCQEIISFALKWRLIVGECYSEGFSFSTNVLVQVHELPPEKLKIRDVVHIDIANDPVSSADYKPSEDPTKFKSEKTGRGPLVGPDWMKKVFLANYKPMSGYFIISNMFL
uniref:Phosphatidylinositol transfer protein N-terminal domain-containing protein n=1 Tax=Phlebotomus papatasi TaxID=29031 RepID=A0A1B0EVP2_PHLPP